MKILKGFSFLYCSEHVIENDVCFHTAGVPVLFISVWIGSRLYFEDTACVLALYTLCPNTECCFEFPVSQSELQ